MKFRKKPVTVDAIKFTNELNLKAVPEWFMTARLNGTVYEDGDCLKMKTLEGLMTAEKGDWIIQGVEGEIYSCKPEIFKKTYESVDTPVKEKRHMTQEEELTEKLLTYLTSQQALTNKTLKLDANEVLKRTFDNLTRSAMNQVRPKRIW